MSRDQVSAIYHVRISCDWSGRGLRHLHSPNFRDIPQHILAIGAIHGGRVHARANGVYYG